MAEKPKIRPLPNGPYRFQPGDEPPADCLMNSRGESFDPGSGVSLCRCGGSGNKPFCDGTHRKNGFSDAKITDGSKDKRDDYTGKGITIHDNRGICAHAGKCTDGLKQVFRLKTEPWIDPDAAPVEEIIAVIKQCPSGALSYSVDGAEHRDQDRPPKVTVTRNGPYAVTGGVELDGVERGKGASLEHYTLCRCGQSKNKPFCDGSHWYAKFEDPKN